MSDLASTVFWHACRRSDLPSIQQHGLLPSASRSRSKAVYLADDRFAAENYANFDPDTEWVVLEIRGSDLDEQHLSVDDYEFPQFLEGMSDDTMVDLGILPDQSWWSMNWAISLKACNQVAYTAVIAPENLRVHELEFASSCTDVATSLAGL